MRKWAIIGGGALLLLALLAALLLTPSLPHGLLRKRYGQPPSQFLALPGGGRAHFRDRGPRKAPAILLLHGSASSLHTWEGWVRHLTPAYRVLTVDLPGHGLTGALPQGDYSHKGMLRFIHSFAKARGLTRFVLGGNSMGGSLSWKYALAHPQQISHLLLVDASGVPRSGPTRRPLGFQIAAIPVLRNILKYLTPRALVERGIKRSYADPSKVDKALVDRYYQLLLHRGNRSAMVRRFASYKTLTKEPDMSGIKVPTLILWGAKDTLTPLAMSEVYLRQIRGSRRIVYPQLGHIPMEEDPDATVKDVLSFLNEHLGRSPPAPRKAHPRLTHPAQKPAPGAKARP